jgi:ABC-type transporter Mla subunit MlaD
MLTSLNSEEAAASDETVAEALAYLLERSDTQEGQLAKLYSDLQCLADRFNERERQWTKLSSELNRLTITAEKRDEQIQSLYSSGLSLAESVRQHSDCIKYLEGCLTRLADSLGAIAKSSQNRPAQSTPATSANSLASWCRSWVGAARPTT